jgi:hypothetical protein
MLALTRRLNASFMRVDTELKGGPFRLNPSDRRAP